MARMQVESSPRGCGCMKVRFNALQTRLQLQRRQRASLAREIDREGGWRYAPELLDELEMRRERLGHVREVQHVEARAESLERKVELGHLLERHHL